MDRKLQNSTILEDYGDQTVVEEEEEEEDTEKVAGEDDNVEEDDDDDEEEEEDETKDLVTLGFVEKPKNTNCLLRHFFPSKAGGVPAWLDPMNLPSLKSWTCGFCGDPLQFLLQVYAPISGSGSTFHRTLYVFMCPSMLCLLKDQHEQWKCRADRSSPRSVKVFRCQLPHINPFYSSEPPKHDGHDKPSGAGAPLCCWCGTWKGEKVCSSCKRARYCSEKHQAMHWRSGHKSVCRQILISSEVSDSTRNVKLQTKNTVSCNTLWPEYEIVIKDECIYDDKASEDCGLATSLVTKQHKVDDSFQVLLDKFQADDDKKSWASFQECIGNAPEQVLRYCRDVKARPLWPVSAGRPSKADIPKCSYCTGPLSYEFQILPQLLYYFAVKNDAESLDWATIVVYTCSASCDASLGYKEEFPWVQIYSSSSIP